MFRRTSPLQVFRAKLRKSDPMGKSAIDAKSLDRNALISKFKFHFFTIFTFYGAYSDHNMENECGYIRTAAHQIAGIQTVGKGEIR